jgi:tetratricopeptide (TPR) repeat protein
VPIRWFESRLSATPSTRHGSDVSLPDYQRQILYDQPEYRHFLSNALGGILLRAGRMDEAIARVNEGIASMKELEIPTDWAYLALAHARKGSLAEARRWLERLRTSPPASSAAFWDLHELAMLRGEAESLLLDAGFPDDPFAAPPRS